MGPTGADFDQFFGDHYESIVRALTLVYIDRSTAEDAAQSGFERSIAREQRATHHEQVPLPELEEVPVDAG